MIKNYFLVGLRSLIKDKWFALIKIIGLALGLAAAMVIGIYIQEDLSFDKFHQNYNRIFRVLTIDMAEGVSSKLVGVTPPPLGPAVLAELPEAVDFVRLRSEGRLNLSYEDKLLRCDACYRTESSFFEIFGFQVLEGKTKGVLDEPNTVAITETLAQRIFGDESPIGKSIKVNQTLELYVVAMVADPPTNSHIQFDLLRSYVPAQNEANYEQNLLNWGGLSDFTYLLFDREIETEEVAAKIQSIAKKNNAVEFFVPTLQPLGDVHLKSKEIIFEQNYNKSDIQNVWILTIVVALILFLAIINFANLVTAKSTCRAKEVGVRKVVGAFRNQLIGQHLSESFIVVILSALLGCLLVFLLLPFLNDFYQRGAEVRDLFQGYNIFLVLALVLVVGLVAGIYPAFVLSSFNPLSVLKGAFKNSTSGVRLRKFLVIFQFTISIALIVGTAIIYQQMDFIFTADLGYNRDQIVSFSQNIRNSESLKNELSRNPAIRAIGTSSTQLGQQLPRTGILPEGFSGETSFISSVMTIDETFIPTMGMTIQEGRNFSLDYSDSSSVIINEEMVKLLEWEEPIGKRLTSGEVSYIVTGVIKDFHFATIRHRVEPLFMIFNPQNNQMAIKIAGNELSQSLAFIEGIWKELNPDSPFEYSFLEADFANLYRGEQAFAAMILHFAVLAIFIACLGLFALSAFTTEQKRKEISIRKVLGASPGIIWMKLSIDFIYLILVAFIIASILSFLVMSRWLQDFHYRIEIGLWIFFASGMVSLLIALFTISFQTLKASYSNPVVALKGE